MKFLLICFVLTIQYFVSAIKIKGNIFQCLNSTVLTVKNIIALQEQNAIGVDTLVHNAQLNQIISDIGPLLKTCKFRFTPPADMELCLSENFDEFQAIGQAYSVQKFLSLADEFENVLERIFKKCGDKQEKLQYFEDVFNQPPQVEQKKQSYLRPSAGFQYQGCSNYVIDQAGYVLYNKDSSQISSLQQSAYNCSQDSSLSPQCSQSMGMISSSQDFNQLQYAYDSATYSC